MTRFFIYLAPLAFAACAEEAGQSTYFDTVNPPVDALEAQRREKNQQIADEIRARNEAALSGNDPLIVRSDPSGQSPLITQVEPGSDASLTAALSQAISDAENGNATQAGVQTSVPVARSGNPQVGNNAPDPSVTLTNDAGITDNSFQRIKKRDSIETDAERLAAAQSQLVVINPEALPDRAKANVASFALATTHAPGKRVYRRGAGTRGTQVTGCGRYRSKDDAQRAFLAAGGPSKDRLNLDPDGDGFVCGWSPLPFRNLQIPKG